MTDAQWIAMVIAYVAVTACIGVMAYQIGHLRGFRAGRDEERIVNARREFDAFEAEVKAEQRRMSKPGSHL